jgi:hypothetical protein
MLHTQKSAECIILMTLEDVRKGFEELLQVKSPFPMTPQLSYVGGASSRVYLPAKIIRAENGSSMLVTTPWGTVLSVNCQNGALIIPSEARGRLRKAAEDLYNNSKDLFDRFVKDMVEDPDETHEEEEQGPRSIASHRKKSRAGGS